MIGGALLDISGVLHQGDVTGSVAVEVVRHLRNACLRIHFLTNSTRRPKLVILTNLQPLGFEIDSGSPGASCRSLVVGGVVSAAVSSHGHGIRGTAPHREPRTYAASATRCWSHCRAALEDNRTENCEATTCTQCGAE
ncbi:hypothetical protein [Aliiruegeria lutimaris]|uniref:hypothetical protein n=1 Tax=Aliiruegeria lutimaris TaxID=571298 RepID=UPI000B86B0A5